MKLYVNTQIKLSKKLYH